MTTMETLVTQLQVQRLVWRERIDSLSVERDRAERERGDHREFNQLYGAIESLVLIIGEMDHILRDLKT
jgi:cytidylate kinase